MQDPTEHCPYAESDADQRYLAGSLSPAEADAFERHYFECDRCWSLVQRGSEIKSALHDTLLVAPGSRINSKNDSMRVRRWGMPLAAAAVALLAIGVWRTRGPGESMRLRESPADSAQVMRGSTKSMTVSSNVRGSMLIAAWAPAKQANSYRVRLLSADGALLYERETADTSVVLSGDSIGTARQAAYWEIQALNELRNVIAASALTPTSLTGTQR